jgi:hypothetical protein
MKNAQTLSKLLSAPDLASSMRLVSSLTLTHCCAEPIEGRGSVHAVVDVSTVDYLVSVLEIQEYANRRRMRRPRLEEVLVPFSLVLI